LLDTPPVRNPPVVVVTVGRSPKDIAGPFEEFPGMAGFSGGDAVLTGISLLEPRVKWLGPP
jgi:hypothetical protein